MGVEGGGWGGRWGSVRIATFIIIIITDGNRRSPRSARSTFWQRYTGNKAKRCEETVGDCWQKGAGEGIRGSGLSVVRASSIAMKFANSRGRGTWILGTDRAVDAGERETAQNLSQLDRSQHLPDAHRLPGTQPRTLQAVPAV